ncbi:trafficking protein particle complex subunit 6B-like [Asparagus officinalis]|uniref:trafficking protein particle complex subunit 6B-like n=1 Tax=Asparagus officinalis TaxID=4686 RepID=UPI00098E2206|nr:trafficking protein particle complex subunit 6B-like [Asparagus officinalis]
MGGDREVCESCMEGVITEMVSAYSSVKPDLAARRIEAIGYQVGNQLCERYTMGRPRFTDHLEAIKFLCKDFWSKLFKKQIDNLKTNNRGTYVLQDNRFSWLKHIPADFSMENMDSPAYSHQSSSNDKMNHAMSLHLYFPCGIIRGALSSVGIPCAVSADVSNLPACSFVVRVKA